LRKYLIAALAAALSIAVAATAIGAGPASGTLSITPTKAGTKKKPRAIALKLSVKNETPGTTASRIDVFLPRFVRASGKGLKTCSASKAAGNHCPRGSKAGSGTSNALVNPTSPTPAPLHFKVTVFNGGLNKLLFLLQQKNEQGQVIPSGVTKVLTGRLTRASGANFYQKLRINIPDDLQQPAPGVYSALQDLTTTLSLKTRKHSLLRTVGCPASKQHVLGVALTYAPNPGPPPRPSGSAEATSRCSKA
jgi:hypothetical protein